MALGCFLVSPDLHSFILFLFPSAPECHAEVQVSVPALLEVQLGHKVSISCTHTTEGHDGLPLVEWFIVSMRVLGRRIMAAGGVVLLDALSNQPFCPWL